MKYLITFFEIIYLYYMFFLFKTKYSIHHPLEILFQDIPYAKHPIDTGIYENKICDLGRYFYFAYTPFLILKDIYPNLFNIKFTIFVTITMMLVAFLLNLNAFIYLIPIMISEFIKIYL